MDRREKDALDRWLTTDPVNQLPEYSVDEFGNDYHALCKCGHPFTDHAIKGESRDECQTCDCRLFTHPTNETAESAFESFWESTLEMPTPFGREAMHKAFLAGFETGAEMVYDQYADVSCDDYPKTYEQVRREFGEQE
jgi:hypothetical protein